MILEDIAKGKDTMKIVALRYFNPVGAHISGLIGELPSGKPDNLVPIITETAIGKRSSMTVFGGNYKTRDGSAVRDYVHVSDIARAHVLALKHLEKKTAPKYDVINLGTGKGSTVLEMIASFQKATGQKLNFTIGPKRPGDIEAVYSDTKKAKKVLRWKPELGLKEMMESAWKWQQNIGIK
jgi:UDP-glucose 4-epimerase